MMPSPIYLDHNATTPVDLRVFEAMRPYFCEIFGNAASRSHEFGAKALAAVDDARAKVAGLLNAEAGEIIFTSGATESNNLAIKGVAEMYASRGRHLISQATEHKAVLDPCQRLRSQGCPLTVLPVDGRGRVSVEQLAEAIRPDTVLVSIMYANNETGTLQPIGEIGRLCHERGVLFHCDATQAVGHVPVDVAADEIDLLSLSAHKLYGPKGVGALYVRKRNPRVRLSPLLDGGGHERGFRSGTLNVPGIVGLGVACEIARLEMAEHQNREAMLRDRLEEAILSRNRFVTRNGDAEHRLPHTSNLSFAYVEGESVMLALDDVAVSSGSACTSASLEPSHVLAAMGIKPVLAHSSIRFGVGRSTTVEQIDYVAEKLTRVLERLREMSPLYELAMEGQDPDEIQWAPASRNAER